MIDPERKFSGQIIRGYEFSQRIAKAGFGEVYLARQLNMDRDVAVKMILPQYATQFEFIQRFEHEARLIARLEHPNIVPVHDYWRDDDGNAFIVMRYMRGGNLRGFTPDNGVSLEIARRLVSQIASALEFAHQQGVVHRDIKPDNILLDELQNFYLSDFGIAKSPFAALNITGEQFRLGTLPYSSTEQMSSGTVSPASDQYGLGIVMYEALTGEHPFPDSPARHLGQALPSLKIKRPDLPAALDDVLRRATAKTADKRYPTIQGFSAAFREAAGEQGPFHTPAPRATAAVSPMSMADSGVIGDPRQLSVNVMENTPTERFPLGEPAMSEHSAMMLTTIHDVPHRAERMIGREEQVDALYQQLERGERLLLHGMGGIGKTSLAAEIAVRFVEKHGGISLWLYAGEQPPEALLAALARAFDAQGRITPLAGEAAASAIRNLLSERSVRLIVIDNAWNEAALKAVVNALPREMPALITSRQRMAAGKIVDVSALAPEQALELLGYHAAQTFAADDKAALELCKLLGYHPLALEIAGKTLQVDDLTPAELVKQIGEAPHKLRSPDSRDLTEAGSLAELLTSSISGLEDKDRFLFLTFGALFAPRATVALLARTTGQDEAVVEEGLKTLARRGLVKRTRTKAEIAQYQVHDLAYSFARAETTLTPAAAIAACRIYVVQKSDSFAPLDAEIDNLLGAAEKARELKDDAALADIMFHLTVSPPYFEARGYSPQSVALLEAAAAAAQRADIKREAHYMLEKLGTYYREQRHDRDRALAAYEHALQITREIGNMERTAFLLTRIGSTRWLKTGESPLPFYDEAQQLAEAHNSKPVLALLNHHRGYYENLKKEPDLEASWRYSNDAVQLSFDLGMVNNALNSLLNRAMAEKTLGRLDDAIRTDRQVLTLATEHDDIGMQVYGLWGLGEDYHALNQWEEAQKVLTQAHSMAKSNYFSAEAERIAEYMRENNYVVEATLA
jgi:serine/threonine-protein kinase